MLPLSMGVVRVSPSKPRIKITLSWGCDASDGQILLYMKRTGDATEFAAYAPLDIQGSILTFEFDELLWVQPYGRFTGRLVVGTQEIQCLSFEYSGDITVMGVQNV